MTQPTLDEVLDHYRVTKLDENTIELTFHEGGQSYRVALYFRDEDAIRYSEEDSMAHWMNILKRTWSDD